MFRNTLQDNAKPEQASLRDRTAYSARNAALGPATKVLGILFGYITRIVFIRLLSSDYVGINGLLSNVLGAFTLPMLGVDTALAFAMYRPVACGDRARQRQLMELYRKVYGVFALTVAAAGAAFYPFLPRLVGRPFGQLGVIYIMFLAATVCSYLWAAPGLVFLVYQRNYINDLMTSGALITQYILQTAVLLLTRNYMMFLSMNIICTLACNIARALLCRKEYPFLWDKKEPPLPRSERTGILTDIRAMLIHKVGAVIINCTDNMILTKLFSLMAVARYANYYLIIGSAEQVLRRIIYGVVASVGNMGATEDRGFVARIFRACVFAAFCIYGISSACLFVILGDFIGISFGENYVLSQTLTLVLCLNFFLNGMRNATLVYRDALGLFRYDRWKSVTEALTNLGLSVLLARAVGMPGVFLGTTLSILLVSFWIEPLVLYKEYLKAPLLPYFTRFAAYFATSSAGLGLAWLLCRRLPGGFAGFLLKLPIGVIVPAAVIVLVWRRSEEYGVLKEVARTVAMRMASRFGGERKKEEGRDEE